MRTVEKQSRNDRETFETVEKQGSNVFKVSQSKMKTWRKCRQAYHLRYVEKLYKKTSARPLVFGRLIHSMIETYANGDEPMDVLDNISLEEMKLFKSERDMYGDLIDDVRCIMTEYFLHWGDDSLKYIRWNKRGAEHEFEIEIMDGMILTGKIDAFARTANKMRWMVEHKSFGNIPGEDDRWRNIQSPTYLRVAEMLGMPPVDGVLWDYIHSKPPSYPQLLKNGTMSKKAINTLPSRVIATLRKIGAKERDHKHMIDMATKNRSRYFVRAFTSPKRAVTDAVWQDFIESATEMRELHGKRRAKTIDRHCTWCDYESICRAELCGHDVDFIKESDFHVKEREEREIITE